MSDLLRKLMRQHRLMDEAGDEGSAGGGAGSESGNDESATAAEDEGTNEGKAEDKAPTKTKPTDAEAKLLKENMQRKKALSDANEKLAKAAEQLKAFEGVDPEEIKSLIKAKKDAEEQQLAAKGEWEGLKKRMADAHASEKSVLEKAKADAVAENARLKKTIGDLTVGSQFGASKYIADEMLLTPNKARRLYGDHFDVQEDGSIVGYDKPAGAEGRVAFVDASGDPLGFDDVMKALVAADPERDFLVKSKVRSGAGSGTATTTTKARPGTQSEDKNLNGVDKIAAGLKSAGLTIKNDNMLLAK